MKNCIVVDLDGTVCDSSHRDHLAQAGQWDDFHKALTDDKPWKDAKELIFAMNQYGMNTIAVTGRNERHRCRTLGWLRLNEIEIDMLLMRRDDDFRSDTEVKPALLSEHFGSMQIALESVLFILDDRDKVVQKWRDLGFRCWQVQPGGY